MTHLKTENILGFIDGSSTTSVRTETENHLKVCRECDDLRMELTELMTRLQADSAYEPPVQLMQWGIDLFQPVVRPEAVGAGAWVRKFVASLVFDTYDQPLMAGVRRVGAPPRQLLFRAGDVDVDVKIESMETNDRITLVGQVLSSGAKFFDNTPVKLESHGIVRYKTRTNLVGEFSFDEVPKDTYHLSVDLPEGQITLFCVHRANS